VVDAERREAYGKREAVQARFAALNAAERNVLQLVLEGTPNKGIAAQLGVSRRTVEDRRARLMRKLGVGSLPELVRCAIGAGFARSA
jgi:RNA polymerase sigma factor (sigma-70 family)